MTLSERIAAASLGRCSGDPATCHAPADGYHWSAAMGETPADAVRGSVWGGTPSTADGTHAYRPTRSGLCDTCGRAQRVPSHGYGTPEWLRRGRTGENAASDRTGL